MELVNETNIEQAYKIFVNNINKNNDFTYSCTKTAYIFKENYLQFKEFIHNKRFIGFIDLTEGKLIIIENAKKTNSNLKYLIYRFIYCDSIMFNNVESLLKKMFLGKGIEKIKIICNKEEIKDSVDFLHKYNYFLDLKYVVGEHERMQFSKYLYEND